jgi:hypothetical protein
MFFLIQQIAYLALKWICGHKGTQSQNLWPSSLDADNQNDALGDYFLVREAISPAHSVSLCLASFFSVTGVRFGTRLNR